MFRRASFGILLYLGDQLLLISTLVLASWLRPQLEFGKPLSTDQVWLDWPVYLLIVVVWTVGFTTLQVYNLPKNLQATDETRRLLGAHLLTTLAFAGVLYFSFREVSRLQILTFTALSLIALISNRALLRALLQLFGDKRYGTRRVLIIGAGHVGQQVCQMIREHEWTGLKLIGFMDNDSDVETQGYPHFGSLNQTLRVVAQEQITEVVFTLPRYAHHELANLVAELETLNINLRVIPDLFDLVFLRSTVEDFGGMPLVTLREPALQPLQRLTKRLFDLLLGLPLTLVSLPFMVIIATLVKLTSPDGPILFCQNRIGEYGKPFKMYKFRTMIPNAEQLQADINQLTDEGQIIHKVKDDPRITPIGRILRRFSLDELPQLFNVLKGEMSLVGPRPELPWLVEQYEPWQRKRFQVPQGITGWWQINGRADKLMHLHTEDDLYYIKNYSIWLDLKILWYTIKAVVDKSGAY